MFKRCWANLLLLPRSACGSGHEAVRLEMFWYIVAFSACRAAGEGLWWEVLRPIHGMIIL